MKKIIALFLSIALLMTAAAGLAETATETKELKLEITAEVMPKDAMEIMNDETNRALLTVLLWLELSAVDDTPITGEDTFANFLLNDNYVSSDGQFIAVTGYSEGTIYSLFYDPATGECQYAVKETSLSDEDCAAVIKEAGEQMQYCYKNDLDTIVTVVNALNSIMEEE